VKTDTICAVATPPGVGGIAVVRVSGPLTFPVLDRVVRGFRPSRQPDHTVRFGRVVGRDGAELDEVVVAAFRAPRSYTGEDVAEVSCHGGDYIAGELVRLFCGQGCRPAGPGEFSRRAVLNGRLSLSRAEAVLDLINARTPQAHAAALARYHGGLAHRTRAMLAELDECRARLEYYIGFDESDAVRPRDFEHRGRRLLVQVERLSADAERARFLHEGARVAIVGRSNVGKSTLFNRLAGEERALVAPGPGTTRDRVETTVAFGGVPVLLSDTGGIPARTGGRLARGVAERTAQAVDAADLVIAVFDGSEPARPADRRVLRTLDPTAGAGREVLCVVNKCDRKERLGAGFLSPCRRPVIRVSARTGTNIGRLRSFVARRFRPGRETAATNRRHRSALNDCRAALARALTAPDSACALAELELAHAALAGLDAPADRADVLDRVFNRFCVGK